MEGGQHGGAVDQDAADKQKADQSPEKPTLIHKLHHRRNPNFLRAFLPA